MIFLSKVYCINKLMNYLKPFYNTIVNYFTSDKNTYIQNIVDKNMFDILVKASTHGNQRLRNLQYNNHLSYQDIIYVLYIRHINNYFFKIGRTSLKRINIRMKEHIRKWGPVNVILADVIKINHPRIEECFHNYMKTYKEGSLCADIKAHGTKYKEFYIHNNDVLEQLYSFTKSQTLD